MNLRNSKCCESRRLWVFAVVAAGLVAGFAAQSGCSRETAPLSPSESAARLDQEIDWSAARLIAVQNRGRNKTLDSFSRELIATMTGDEHLPGLSPTASLFEWLFHRDAYADEPIVRIKDLPVGLRMAGRMTDERRARYRQTKRFTPRELDDEFVDLTLRDLGSQPIKRAAANRAMAARSVALGVNTAVAIIPPPGGAPDERWAAPLQIMGNLAPEALAQLGLTHADLPEAARFPLPGLDPGRALELTVRWATLRSAWLAGDAQKVQQTLDRLSMELPALASAGVYPSSTQRAAEARYYAMGKFTGGWVIYFLGTIAGIWALLTRWRTPWVIGIGLLVLALAWHAYGVGLRWYILGRIPNANIFEAVVGAAGVGILITLLVELFRRTRVLLIGASATGFAALLLATYMLPGGELGTLMSILDHVMLRIHTVLIITSYALTFVAAIVAVVYLAGYYYLRVMEPTPRLVLAAAGGGGGALGGGGPVAPRSDRQLPQWLNDIDKSHTIMLHMIVVMLFLGGVVLGAIWAADSWGRPWGWDAKEVFALNTWIIYVILIHVRMVVRQRGLWTAWLSLAGCGVMAFNWFYVNFYINSIHSYA